MQVCISCNSGYGSGMSSQVASAEPGLRERKRHETREQLHHAALRLVAERGLADVTVDDIAAAGNVSRRTFFNYFPSKESAVLGSDPARAEDLAERVRARPAEESPFDAVAAVLVEEVSAFRTDPGRWRQVKAVFADNPHLAAVVWGANHASEKALVLVVCERMGVRPQDSPYPMQLVAAVSATVRSTFSYLMAFGGGVRGRDQLTRRLWAAVETLRGGLAMPVASDS